VGRLTFTDDLAHAIRHLLESEAPYGTYNVTGDGPSSSWAEIAREVYRLTGHAPERVSEVTTEEYFASASSPVAPRPRNSVLDLTKLRATGYEPGDAWASLSRYLAG
jgi:dTDP-4-dehydrorhamnose 3,5-epimerase